MVANKVEMLKSRIKEALLKPLPGLVSQYKLAPVGREHVKPADDKKDAAVLILIYLKNGIFYTVFIKRNNYDGPHSGQISFPGGKFDNGDHSLQHTAIRETYEEIGVHIDPINIIGKLTPLYIPVSKFYVLPFIAITNLSLVFEIDSHEVQYLIEAPLKRLIFENQIRTMEITNHGGKIHVPCFDIDGNYTWGATAMILNEFIELIKNSDTDFSFL